MNESTCRMLASKSGKRYNFDDIFVLIFKWKSTLCYLSVVGGHEIILYQI